MIQTIFECPVLYLLLITIKIKPFWIQNTLPYFYCNLNSTHCFHFLTFVFLLLFFLFHFFSPFLKNLQNCIMIFVGQNTIRTNTHIREAATPGRQDFHTEYGVFSLWFAEIWDSSLNQNENIPGMYPVWKCLPLGSPQTSLMSIRIRGNGW